ncbi:hypothetical protein LTS09_009357 [Friedmanniomyces endolithicus]|nr:hypothetical protein LTS09_009357 [Friedmanniomyces endolithicus]
MAQQPDHSHHLHKRLHSNIITGKASHHRHRSRAKETVQSAIDLVPPISFEHLLRRDKKTPDSSQGGSATPQQRDEAERRAQQQAQVEAERAARRRVTPQHVAKAKADNAKREEELRRSLKQVEELGMSSTRQLDDTHYAILEKAAILRSTVASLQQLAEESKRMRAQFEGDATKVEEDTAGTLAGLKNFDEQERTINELVEKLQKSKRDTAELNARLESARERVAAFERRQKEKWSKRRKQWQASWGALVGVLVLVIAVLVFKHRRRLVLEFDLTGGLAEGVAAIRSLPVLQAKASPSQDPYLHRLFDIL